MGDQSSGGLLWWRMGRLGRSHITGYDVYPKLKLGIMELKEGIKYTLGHGIGQPRLVKRRRW